MRARLKRRNSFKWQLIRLGIIFIIIIFSFWLTFKILYDNIDLKLNNNTYLNYLVNDSFGKFNLNDLANLSSTEFLLKYSFGIEKINNGTNVDIITKFPQKDEEEVNNEIKKTIYIYNSHQTEGYKSNVIETFNINNTVFLASHILGEYLSDLGFGVVIEENSIVDILNTNGWKYGSSYKASRILMEEAFKNNPTLDFFIDLHRDAGSYERTTTEINGNKCAKILFVVGLEHDNYEKNLKLANNLNNIIKEKYPGLSRGVMEKKGKGVNGKYNQDFNENTILLEVGGQYNYIEEVNNTLKLVASALNDYLKGEV